jgi:hypothetical protein
MTNPTPLSPAAQAVLDAYNEDRPVGDSLPRNALVEALRALAVRSANNRYKNLDPRIKLYYGARKRALSDGQKFTITVDDIVIPETCPVFGDKIEDGTGSGPTGGGFNDYSASLDRIDNSKGYEPGNIAVISRRANRTKNDSSVSDLVNLLVYSSKNGELLNESHLLVLSNLINNSKGKDFSND